MFSTILCSTQLYSALLNYTLLCWTILYSTELYSALLNYTLLYWTILCSTQLYSALLNYTLLYWTILCSTELYSALLNYTLLYSTILFSAAVHSTKLHYTLFCCTVDRVRKHHLWWNNFYHPFSCSIWSNHSDFFFVKILSTFLPAPVNFLTVKDPPYDEKNWKYFWMLFLIAQIKRLGHWTQRKKNRSPLQSTVLEII